MRVLVAMASFVLAGNLFGIELISGTYQSEGVYVGNQAQGVFSSVVDFNVADTEVDVNESFTVDGNTISLKYSIMRQPLFEITSNGRKIGEGHCMELMGMDILQCQLSHTLNYITYNTAISFSEQGIFRSGRIRTPDGSQFAWTDVLNLIP